MTHPTILVTGATGKTGGAVAAQLRSLDVPVRALVHRRDLRSERLERLGAEVVVADLYDPGQLLTSMRGVARAYYCPPTQPFMIQSAVAFAAAARQARLEQIVLLSQWLSSPAHPTLMTRQTWLADTLFALLPEAAFTIVNPGFFADNYLRLIGFAAHLGIFPSLFGDTRNAPPSNEDIARVATACLLDPALHDRKRYRPTGPELLSVRDMAAILSKVLERRVRTVPMPHWLFAKAARMQGVSAFELGAFLAYVQDHKDGAFEHGAPSSDVLGVTGAPPESFETTARRYAALPEARRSFAATAKAVFDFMRAPLMPGYDLASYQRGLGSPVPPSPQRSMHDEGWLASHPGRTIESAGPAAILPMRAVA